MADINLKEYMKALFRQKKGNCGRNYGKGIQA